MCYLNEGKSLEFLHTNLMAAHGPVHLNDAMANVIEAYFKLTMEGNIKSDRRLGNSISKNW